MILETVITFVKIDTLTITTGKNAIAYSLVSREQIQSHKYLDQRQDRCEMNLKTILFPICCMNSDRF